MWLRFPRLSQSIHAGFFFLVCRRWAWRGILGLMAVLSISGGEPFVRLKFVSLASECSHKEGLGTHEQSMRRGKFCALVAEFKDDGEPLPSTWASRRHRSRTLAAIRRLNSQASSGLCGHVVRADVWQQGDTAEVVLDNAVTGVRQCSGPKKGVRCDNTSRHLRVTASVEPLD